MTPSMSMTAIWTAEPRLSEPESSPLTQRMASQTMAVMSRPMTAKEPPMMAM